MLKSGRNDMRERAKKLLQSTPKTKGQGKKERVVLPPGATRRLKKSLEEGGEVVSISIHLTFPQEKGSKFTRIQTLYLHDEEAKGTKILKV